MTAGTGHANHSADEPSRKRSVVEKRPRVIAKSERMSASNKKGRMSGGNISPKTKAAIIAPNVIAIALVVRLDATMPTMYSKILIGEAKIFRKFLVHES